MGLRTRRSWTSLLTAGVAGCVFCAALGAAPRRDRAEAPTSQPAGALSGWRGGGPPGPPAKDPAEDRPLPLRPDEIDELMAFTRDHFPAVHRELLAMRQQDGRVFRQMVRQVGPPIVRLMRLARTDPQAAQRIIASQKLEMRIRELGHQYRTARNERQRDETARVLREAIAERLTLRTRTLREEIDTLQRRLDEQNRRLEHQQRDRQRILDEEFARAVGEPRREGPGRERSRKAESRPADNVDPQR